jgi:hypothetical protein
MSAIRTFLVLLFAALVFPGCAGISVDADWDTGADFSRLRSWAWFPEPPATTGDLRLDNPLLHKRIRESIEAVMAARGYPRTQVKEADFLVAPHAAIESRLDAQTIQTGYGYGAGWGRTETYIDQYEQGTLVIDFVTPDRKNLLWRGTATARLNEAKNPAQRDIRMRDAIERILAQFPPAR